MQAEDWRAVHKLALAWTCIDFTTLERKVSWNFVRQRGQKGEAELIREFLPRRKRGSW